MNKEFLTLLFTLIDKDLNIATLSAKSEEETKNLTNLTQKIRDDFKMTSNLLPKE